MKPDMLANWMQAVARALRYRNPYIVRMVQLASMARTSNMSRETVVEQVLKEKSKMIKVCSIDYATMCLNGQIKDRRLSALSARLNLSLTLNDTKSTITAEDVTTGFMIFLLQKHCHFPSSCTPSFPPRAPG